MSERMHAAHVFAPGRTQETTLGELFVYWFRASGYKAYPDRAEKVISSENPATKSVWAKLVYLQCELFCPQLSFFAYSPLRCLLDALSHRKQRSTNCK